MSNEAMAWPGWPAANEIFHDTVHRIARVDWPLRKEMSRKLKILGDRKAVLQRREVDYRRNRKSPDEHLANLVGWYDDLQYLGNEITWALLSQ